MTFRDFEADIVERMKKDFPTMSVSFEDEDMLNGVKGRRMQISESEMATLPASCLNELYRKYQSGEANLESFCSEVVLLYKNAVHNEAAFSTENLDLWEKVKDRLVVCLVNYEKNSAMLKNMPWVAFLDLAVVVKIKYRCKHGLITGFVTNTQCSIWGKSAAEVYSVAVKNTLLLTSCVIQTLGEAAGEMDVESTANVWYVGVEDEMYGASVMLFPDILKKISEKAKGSFYVLPSSIHSIIVFPADADWQKWRTLLRNINQNEVSPEEVLGENVYFYNNDDNTLTMCE